MSIRHQLVVWTCSLAVVASTAGCGSDVPTKAEFVDRLTEGIGDETTSELQAAGIDAGEAERLVENYLGCIYDEIKSDEDLLTTTYDNSREVDESIAASTAGCSSDLVSAISSAAGTG